MIVLIRIQDAFKPLSLRVILIVSACFYIDMNCFGPVHVVSSWLRVDSVATDSFGWLVADGFGWLRMVSDGLGWFWVVCCFSSYGCAIGCSLIYKFSGKNLFLKSSHN